MVELDYDIGIIGGGAADADAANGGHWLGAIGSHIRELAFSEAGQKLRVGRAILGNDAGVIGAAELGIRALSDSG